MPQQRSLRRLAENEVIFREFNEKIQLGYDHTNKLALEDGQKEFYVELARDGSPLQFMCECADEKCTKRIVINVYNYKMIHKQRNQFIVVPGHEVDFLEMVITEMPDYYVVKKLVEVPAQANELNPTSLHNA